MLSIVNVKLYVLPGSHPCAAVEAALALKAIDYDRVDLLPMKIEVEAYEGHPLASIPGARDRMRCDYFSRVEPRQRCRQGIEQWLVALHGRDPVSEWAAAPGRRDPAHEEGRERRARARGVRVHRAR